MSDLIDRQAAIDAMTNTLWHYPNELYRNLNNYEFAKGLAELGLRSVPSAQSERKTGRWIDAVLPNDNGGFPVQVCDQCNTFFPLAYTGGGHRFCPNCGCKMDGGASTMAPIKMEVEHE